MDLDYQLIITQIGEIMNYTLPLGILIGLIERVSSMVVRAATGKVGD